MDPHRLQYRGVALILGLVLGCGDDDLPAVLGDCPPDSTVTWVDAEPVFATYCTHCHSSELVGDDERNGAPEFIDLDTPDDAQQFDWLVWQMIWSGNMPDDGVLVPEEDKLLIWEWLSCGGPE